MKARGEMETADAIRYQKRVNRDLRRHLTALTTANLRFIQALDQVMRDRERSSTEDIERRIARLTNFLEMANDIARYNGLKIDFRTDEAKTRLDAAQRSLAAEFAEVLREWWSFDNYQHHTHTWHSREDFIRDELPKLLAPNAW